MASQVVIAARKVVDEELDELERETLELWKKHVNSIALKGGIGIIIQEKQLPIDEDSKNALLQLRMEMFFDESDILAERVFSGEISIGQYQEEFKVLIKGGHTSTAAIGKGGWDLMGPRDWGRLGTPLREQYRFLRGFVDKISNDRDTVSLAYIKNRARLYGEAIVKSAIQAEAGFFFEDELPWLPRDGSTTCLMRCHCRWELTVVENRGTFSIVEAVWKLGVADHCRDSGTKDGCVERDGHTVIVKVPSDVDVPNKIGGF